VRACVQKKRMLPVTTITMIGTIVAGLWMMGMFAGFAFFKIWRNRLTSGLQCTGLGILLLTLYASLVADCSQPCTLMRSDGVQVPWIRSAVNVAIFFTQQWIVGAVVNLDDNAQSLALLLAGGGGLGFMAADFSVGGQNLYWIWWSISIVLVFLGAIANFYLSRPPAKDVPLGGWAWIVYAFSLIWTAGAPLFQAIGPTMGHASGSLTAPNREVNEILWLVLYFAGVECFGAVSLFARQETYKPFVTRYAKVRMD